MVPGTRKNRVQLRIGMTGVRIPRHVGTWRVEDAIPAINPDGIAVALLVMRHERLETAKPLLVMTDATVCGRMSADWQCQMEQKGWQF